ncbi:MAG: purine-nucleoside phosphorylase [Deltaproteobacteria bacterium]|nr:purine-nucleoside phosphorylase [Deltaproteobacteria bacterium]
MNHLTWADLEEAAAFLRTKIPAGSDVGIILGTGLGGLAGRLKKAGALAYDQIPFFPRSTVESHQGQLTWGRLAGRQVLVLQGRCHLYEGYRPQEIVFPLRVLAALGIKILVVSNAAGGLDPLYRPGDLMLITDHINFTGENPLVGLREEEWGLRFPDMSAAYDPALQELAAEVALQEGIRLRQGVYVGVKGPSLETPAETRFLKGMGAQAVGMSTIMEVIAAVQCGLRVLGLSVITNVNRPDCQEPASLAAIIETACKAEPRLIALVEGILKGLPSEGKV